MYNSVELDKMREDSIKTAFAEIEIIEKKLFQNSVDYYNNHIDKYLEYAANNDLFTDEISYSISNDISNQEEFNQYLWENIKKGLKLLNKTNFTNYIISEDNPIYAIRLEVDHVNDKCKYTFIRPSYIKELADKCELLFEEISRDDQVIGYKIKKKCQTIELPKQRVLTKNS